MSDQPAGHNATCENPEHDKHLCFLMYEGFHLAQPEAYKKVVQNAKYRCRNCSRTAAEARNLCVPIEL